MIPAIREKYNREFSEEKYQSFLRDLNSIFPGAIQFRVAETPVFVPKKFTEKLIAAGEEIINVITQPNYKALTEKSIPPSLNVPNENDHAHVIAIDFAICMDEHGELTPQLIELQGFPTMLAFQSLLSDKYRVHFNIPHSLNNYFNGYNNESYFALLKKIIVADHDSENVILLEVKPHEQKTRIDFYCTQNITGVRPVCITELEQENKKLYYRHNGKKIAVERIYNRIIFDDLQHQKKSLGKFVDLTQDFDVEWVSHPNWFYRISKYTLPLIKSEFAPATYYLNKLQVIPKDLENYVLKPLFSFAGKGVLLNITRGDIEKIPDPQHWILQRKVQYASVIATPDIPAKCEVRLIYFWDDDWLRPRLVHNLTRLSKGEMIGVSYNANKEWVGASSGFFETIY